MSQKRILLRHKKILLRTKKILWRQKRKKIEEEDVDEKRSNFGLSGSYFGVEKLLGVGHRPGWVLEGFVWVNGWKKGEKGGKCLDLVRLG